MAEPTPVALRLAAAKPAEVRGTLALLRYYRSFLASGCAEAVDPEAGWHSTFRMTAADAAARLAFLVHTSITRKGYVDQGLPITGPGWRKLSAEKEIAWRRDQRRLADIARRVRVYQFESAEVRARFADRLASLEDF